MSQNAASKGSEKSNEQLHSQDTAPLLSPEKEAILKELTYIDIRGDHKDESESDKKMVEWTMNQIRKDCGKLPVDKLRLLIESIKRVMIEKTVYQTTIERELKKQREILQKEVEVEKKKPKATTDTGGINDTVVKFFQDHTDIRLFTKNKLEKIGNISPAEQANFILSIEKNDDTMAKFMQGFQTDTRWRNNLKSENRKSYDILFDVYAKLATKYNIKIALDETLDGVREKIAVAKKEHNDGQDNKIQANKIADNLTRAYLTPLQKEVDDIINGDDIKNQSPNTFFKIASVHQKAGDVANQLRKSEQYQALQLMAEKTKDPEIVKKVTIFRERLEELALMSLEYDSVFEARKILTTDKQLNVLTKLKSKIGAMQAGIQKGERRLEFFNLESRNTSKSITEFETDIREKIKIGGPKNVNAEGFSQYLKALHIEGKMTYDYLKTTGFLEQFGLYWKLENGATKSQEILKKIEPDALKGFTIVIQTQQEFTFSKEKIKNRTAFAELHQYLERSGVKKEDIEALSSALEKSKNGGAIEQTIIASLLKSDSKLIQEVAKLALIGHGHQLNAAVAEIGELSKGSIRDVLSKLSTKFVPNDFSDKLELLIKDPKNTEKEFTLDIPITQLYKTPKSREKFIQIIESYIVQPGTKPQDVELLKNILEFIKTDNRVKTTETIKSSTVVRAEIGKAAEKINRTSTGKNAAERLKIAKQDPNMTQLEEKINRATIYNQDAKSEIIEQTVEMDAMTYSKIFAILGLNPEDFPIEKIMSSSALRHEVLNLIGSKDAELEQQLSVSELQKLRSLQSQLVSRVREELLARKEFGTINQYHTDNRRELKNTYPAIASQKEIREAAEVSVTGNSAPILSTQNNSKSYNSVDIDAIQRLPAGTPFQIDTSTIFTMGSNGSCSIITPYSIQIIPPEKTQIALGYIAVAKVFPGLDLMGGLHEALQSCYRHPVLAKMKDGVSKKEQCNLIKHYASALGIHGYNQNVDTPEALIQSIKNSLPIGTNFWELANNNGLLRPNGTINPLALGKTFQDQEPHAKKQTLIENSIEIVA